MPNLLEKLFRTSDADQVLLPAAADLTLTRAIIANRRYLESDLKLYQKISQEISVMQSNVRAMIAIFSVGETTAWLSLSALQDPLKQLSTQFRQAKLIRPEDHQDVAGELRLIRERIAFFESPYRDYLQFQTPTKPGDVGLTRIALTEGQQVKIQAIETLQALAAELNHMAGLITERMPDLE